MASSSRDAGTVSAALLALSRRDTASSSDSGAAAVEATRVAAGAERLLEVVYDDLRALARRRLARLAPGQTLQTTALVHEAWMRVAASQREPWENRAHFFGAAARAMRNILVDQARRRSVRGRSVSMAEPEEPALEAPSPDVMALAVSLRRLEEIDPRKAKVVMLRFFTGLSNSAVADVLRISVPTVERDWRAARAWLQDHIEGLRGGSA